MEVAQMENIYKKIIDNIKNNPRDLKTIPISRTGRWFYTYVQNGNIYVDIAKNHKPSSQLKIIRKLNYNDFEKVYPIYLRRVNGEQISQEATAATRNQVYWYAIIENCYLKEDGAN